MEMECVVLSLRCFELDCVWAGVEAYCVVLHVGGCGGQLCCLFVLFSVGLCVCGGGVEVDSAVLCVGRCGGGLRVVCPVL